MKPTKIPLSNRTILILCGAALLLALISLGSMFDFSWSSLFPSAEDLDQARRDEKKMRIQLLECEIKYAELLRVEAEYQRLVAESWDENTLGSPDVLLPKRLSDLAKELNVETLNTSPVKRSKLNNDLVLLELDVQMAAPLTTLTDFWTKLAERKPAGRWQRIELRPQDLQTSDSLFFRGTLVFFGREGAAAEKPLAGKTVATAAPAPAPAAGKGEKK